MTESKERALLRRIVIEWGRCGGYAIRPAYDHLGLAIKDARALLAEPEAGEVYEVRGLDIWAHDFAVTLHREGLNPWLLGDRVRVTKEADNA